MPWCRCGGTASRRGNPGRAGGRSAGRPARGSRTGPRPVAARPSSVAGAVGGSGRRSSEERSSSSGSMTRSARNWASCSRRRDLRFLVWAANWASTTRSQKSADWLAILRNQAPEQPEAQADHAQDDHRPAQQVLELVDDAPERPEEGQGVDDQEEQEERRAQPEQPLGRGARGVDDRRAQAVQEDRRRERAVQVGEEVDDVQAALDQVAQVVGGQRHGLGRALLAVGDQVADHRQPAEQGERRGGGGSGRRRGTNAGPHLVDQPLGGHLDQPLHHGLDRDLALLGPRPRLGHAGRRVGGQAPRSGSSRSARIRAASRRRLVAGRAAPRAGAARAPARPAGPAGDGGRSTRAAGRGTARTARCCG